MSKDKNNYYKLSRTDLKALYMNKYYELFMNLIQYEELSESENKFINKKWWNEGSIACVNSTIDKSMPVFNDFVTSKYNWLDAPMIVRIVNPRGFSIFPNRDLIVDEECVVGYALKCEKSIKFFVEKYVNRIVNIEMIIGTNIKTHKIPFLLVGSEQDKEVLENIMDKINSDNDEIFINAENVDKVKTLVNSNPYVIDKLYQYKISIENELNTFLGLDNSPSNEERMLVDQINANNEIISESRECIYNSIEAFLKRIKDVLGITITLKKKKSVNSMAQAEDEEGDDEDEE